MTRIFVINFIFIDLPTVQSYLNQALNSLSVRILSDNETLNEARAKPHMFVHNEIKTFLKSHSEFYNSIQFTLNILDNFDLSLPKLLMQENLMTWAQPASFPLPTTQPCLFTPANKEEPCLKVSLKLISLHENQSKFQNTAFLLIMTFEFGFIFKF